MLPIDDTLVNRLNALVPPAWPAGPARTYVPGGGPVADESIPLLFGGFRITADVEVPGDGPSGVLCALGDWNGGYALFVDDGHLVFTFSRSGDVLEVAGDRPVDPATRSLSVTCRLEPGGGGTLTLFHDEAAVGRLAFEGALPIAIQHGGAGLRLGRDTGLPVSTRYRPPAPWNGTLLAVRVETPGGRRPARTPRCGGRCTRSDAVGAGPRPRRSSPCRLGRRSGWRHRGLRARRQHSGQQVNACSAAGGHRGGAAGGVWCASSWAGSPSCPATPGRARGR